MEGVADIRDQVFEPANLPWRAGFLLNRGQGAELAVRLRQRILPRHAGRLQLGGPGLDMEAELVVEIVFEATPAPEMAEPIDPFGANRHKGAFG